MMVYMMSIYFLVHFLVYIMCIYIVAHMMVHIMCIYIVVLYIMVYIFFFCYMYSGRASVMLRLCVS